MKKIILIIIFLVAIAAGGGWVYLKIKTNELQNPKSKLTVNKNLPLTKYDFDELKKRGGIASEIKILGTIKEVQDRRDNCKGKNCLKKSDYSFKTNQIKYQSDGKWITGMINRPNKEGKLPVVIMIRGYADTAGYYSGSGSWKAADYLAANGFVTVSTDFLGYAGSDWPSEDILEARFEKVPAVLDLIESVKKLDYVDPTRIGIWAHSNGGQIVLSVLEVTGANYPTVLWAPMTNPFPQSVIETTYDDEAGRIVRNAIDEFGKHYDFRRYAFENYYSWINAPVVIHQGTADEWCKVEWQQVLQSRMKELGKDMELKIYPGDDHNFSKNWGEVMSWDVEWFKGKMRN